MTLHAVGELVAQLDVEHARPAPPALRQPRGPSPVVLDMLHRGMSDSYVPFSRKVDGEWQSVGSVPAHQLRGLFRDEAIAEALNTDSYFGLHGMYRAGRYRTKHQLPQLMPECRNLDSVRYLTCCHVDLDAYNVGLDTHGAVAAVMRLVDAGLIPPPSVFTLSRGVWALWHLHDKFNPAEPVRTYPKEIVMRRWTKLQKALHVACSAIGSDALTLHAATVTRIPGTVNSKNGRRVGYMIPADTHGKAFSYTLDDLEAFLRPQVLVDAVPVRPAELECKPKNVKLSRRALKGWHGRWHRLNSVLAQLRDMRGGWKVGTRSAAVHYVALTLRALHAEPRKVQHTFSQHLERMQQPAGDTLTLKDCLRVFNGTKKPKHGGPCHQTIADALHVTPDEAGLLSADVKKPFPPATTYGGAALVAVPTVSKRAAAERRLDAVREVCDRLTAAGVQPTGTEVKAHLAAIGLHAALATVLKAMRAVGCPSRQTHRQKPTEATRRLFPR
jgi:hypothetical protein